MTPRERNVHSRVRARPPATADPDLPRPSKVPPAKLPVHPGCHQSRIGPDGNVETPADAWVGRQAPPRTRIPDGDLTSSAPTDEEPPRRERQLGRLLTVGKSQRTSWDARAGAQPKHQDPPRSAISHRQRLATGAERESRGTSTWAEGPPHGRRAHVPDPHPPVGRPSSESTPGIVEDGPLEVAGLRQRSARARLGVPDHDSRSGLVSTARCLGRAHIARRQDSVATEGEFVRNFRIQLSRPLQRRGRPLGVRQRPQADASVAGRGGEVDALRVKRRRGTRGHGGRQVGDPLEPWHGREPVDQGSPGLAGVESRCLEPQQHAQAALVLAEDVGLRHELERQSSTGLLFGPTRVVLRQRLLPARLLGVAYRDDPGHADQQQQHAQHGDDRAAQPDDPAVVADVDALEVLGRHTVHRRRELRHGLAEAAVAQVESFGRACPPQVQMPRLFAEPADQARWHRRGQLAVEITPSRIPHPLPPGQDRQQPVQRMTGQPVLDLAVDPGRLSRLG